MRIFLSMLAIGLMFTTASLADARGGARAGGGGGGGGPGGGAARAGAGGARGGNMGGPANLSGGNRSGANMNSPSRGGNMSRDAGNFNRSGAGDFNRGGNLNPGDFNRGGNLNPAAGMRNRGPENFGSERPGAAPSRDQLNNFLGLPGQDNARREEAAGQRRDDQRFDNQRFDGQRRDDQRTIGDRTPGDRDSRQTDRDSRQTDRENRRTDGFERHSASDRYHHANDVRDNFHHYDVYGRDWYHQHPHAWFAAGWTAGRAWTWNNWAAVGAWMAYPVVTPVYYDYGNNVTYANNNIYVSGENVGTATEYYNQAADIAAAGAKPADNDADWLPLGVFAFCKSGDTSSDLVVQLAVNKQGIIRGNYTDTANNKTQAVNGSVDKETQRVAFTIGDNQTNVVETGLYNLTKDEAPALLHYGQDRTEQWLLVRLKQPDDSAK